MAKRRFHVPRIAGDSISLSGDQARHALRVLRMGVGDTVTLFDDLGVEADGTIRAATARSLVIEIARQRTTARDRMHELTLAVAPPKGNRADWLVEKCAELGVASLVWLTTQRGEQVPGPGKYARWRRKAVEAAKQSGQSSVMAIEVSTPIAEVLADRQGAAVWFGDPADGVPTLSERLAGVSCRSGDEARSIIIVGPEGGLTSEEIEAIRRAHGLPFRLSDAILRIETAAIASASIWIDWALGQRRDGVDESAE